MRRIRFMSAVFVLLLGNACSPEAPARWVEGGAALVIAPARWDRGDDDVVEIRADGQVLEDGEFLLLVDRAGRV